jgi:hypothetical protein
MRIRATVAVACGALALSAFAIPASQAAQPKADHPTLGHLGFASQQNVSPQSAKRSLVAATVPVISKVVVNAGKPIVIGTTAPKKVTVAVTASHASGIADARAAIWTGTTLTSDDSYGFNQNEAAATCKAASATTSTCTVTVTIDPKFLWNTDAKTWKVYAGVLSKDGNITEKEKASTTHLQRLSRLTVNATPEPVKKGATLTVTGKLDRANWDTAKYAGYSTQSVTLQFRKKTSTAYSTVKTVKTSTTGALKTTTKSTVDGAYRYSFAGTTTTPAVIAAGDGIDVK